MMPGTRSIDGAAPVRMAAMLRLSGLAPYRPTMAASQSRLRAANDAQLAVAGQESGLQAVLVRHYASLQRRLARHLGCAELASDSLHDAWLRLGEVSGVEGGEGGAARPLARNPVAYIFRVACNLATDSLRRDRAWLYADEGDGAAGMIDYLADNAVGPERLAELRGDLQRLQQAVELLPRRHQQVLEALRLDEMSRQEVAQRHDMSLRNVDTALRQALDHCARHTGQATVGGVSMSRRSVRLRQG